jgi:hypothetical protein
MRRALSKKPYFRRMEIPKSTTILMSENVKPTGDFKSKLTELLPSKRRQDYIIFGQPCSKAWLSRNAPSSPNLYVLADMDVQCR